MPASDNDRTTPRTLSEVTVGDYLGRLEVPITWRTLMLELLGTRDMMPYHSHPDVAVSLGLNGPFLNTTFYLSLLWRYVNEWCGYGSVLQSITLAMLSPGMVGDVLTLHGNVVAVAPRGPVGVLDIEVEVLGRSGVIVRAKVSIALPLNEGGAVEYPILDRVPEATIPQAAAWPQEVRAVHRRCAPYPVDVAQIMYLVEMVSDANPTNQGLRRSLDVDQRSLVAPPTSLLVWLQARNSQIGIDPESPDVDDPSVPAWPTPTDESQRTSFYRVPGSSDVVVSSVRLECGMPVRPGDILEATCQVVDLSEEKRTHLGVGQFVTFLHTVFLPDQAIAGRITVTQLQYSKEPGRSNGTKPE